MNEIKGPGEMDFTSPNNVSEIWHHWKHRMEYFLAATSSKKSEAEKVAIFMYDRERWAGNQRNF